MDDSTAIESELPEWELSMDMVAIQLGALRPPDAQSMPDEFIIQTPLQGANSTHYTHPLDRAVYDATASIKGLKGKVIAFDLDDTLLNTSYICREAWTFPPALGALPETIESINYRLMRHPASYWIKGGWRRPRRMQYDSARYPFLRNPDVTAQLRPGALALLHGLKAAGATLVLMTICARQRLDFIFARLPALRDAFINAETSRLEVAAAEDLACFTLSHACSGGLDLPANLDPDMRCQWEGGVQAHRKERECFNIKSLPALHAITGMKRLDLLVDDSTKGAEVYACCGLENHYLQAPQRDPYGLVVPVLLEGLISRFGLMQTTISLNDALQWMQAEDYSWLRFEDPLYFPFVHMQDVLQRIEK